MSAQSSLPWYSFPQDDSLLSVVEAVSVSDSDFSFEEFSWILPSPLSTGGPPDRLGGRDSRAVPSTCVWDRPPFLLPPVSVSQGQGRGSPPLPPSSAVRVYRKLSLKEGYQAYKLGRIDSLIFDLIIFI